MQQEIKKSEGPAVEKAKTETTGKALGLHKILFGGSYTDATVEDVVAWVLDNPEGRVAVLAALGHVEDVEDRVVSGLRAELATERSIVEEYIKLTKKLKAELATALEGSQLSPSPHGLSR